MKFSKQEYWRGVAIPFSRGLPNPGIEPRSPTSQADSLLSELSGKTGSNSSSAPNKTLGQRHSFFGAHFLDSALRLKWDINWPQIKGLANFSKHDLHLHENNTYHKQWLWRLKKTYKMEHSFKSMYIILFFELLSSGVFTQILFPRVINITWVASEHTQIWHTPMWVRGPALNERTCAHTITWDHWNSKICSQNNPHSVLLSPYHWYVLIVTNTGSKNVEKNWSRQPVIASESLIP